MDNCTGEEGFFSTFQILPPGDIFVVVIFPPATINDGGEKKDKYLLIIKMTI